MIETVTTKGRIVAAALRLAAERPWGEIGLADIAVAAGVTLADLQREVAGKTDILAAFARAIDTDMLQRVAKPERVAPIGGDAAAPAQPKRDQLFEVVMSRFDALSPHKAALRSIARSGSFEPGMLGHLLTSQHWMLQAAGIGTDGLGGRARVAGLAAVYASVFQTWLDDDDPGMARTMAALDQRIRRGETVLAGIDGVLGLVGRLATAVRGQERKG